MSFTKISVQQLSTVVFKLNQPNFSNTFLKRKLSNSLYNSISRSKATSCDHSFLCSKREYNTAALRPRTITNDDKRDFMAVFPDVVKDLTHLNPEISDLRSLISKIMQYNVSGGKKVRGLTMVYGYRILASEKELTQDNIRLSQILGWCIEMIQGFFVVIDDLVDESETRRGQLCWYKHPDVGLRATSDALLIQSGVFQLLQLHFRDKPYYLPVIELLLDAVRKTTYGQTLDFISAFTDLTQLTMERYNIITKYKTSYYTFHLPVAAAMYMANLYNHELHQQAKDVLLEMGHYFQVQDDFLDVFGDEKITGKNGTDIQDGKYTWLAVVAYQKASPSQRSIFKECYGSKDADKIKAVKDIFTELSLPEIFHAYEEETYNTITSKIKQLNQELPHELFFTLLNKTYGRKH